MDFAAYSRTIVNAMPGIFLKTEINSIQFDSNFFNFYISLLPIVISFILFPFCIFDVNQCMLHLFI